MLDAAAGTARAGGIARDGAADPEIASIAYDSRAVRPGALFAALPGTKTDGAEYVPAAVSAGAVAVLGGGTAAEAARAAGVPALVAEKPRAALSVIANAFYGFPARKLRLIGVTGTNGKTTTAFLVRHLLRFCGKKAGMLGTIEYDTGSQIIPAPLTTPESVDFAGYLAQAAAAGAEYAVAETSSHALALDRVAGCEFAAGVFSNLTRDHLDYHKTFEDYAAAKRKLFLYLPASAAAVVNLDDPYGAEMLDGCAARAETYGVENPRALWNAVGVTGDINGSRFTLRCPAGEFRVELPLPGRHNIHNTLAAVTVLASLGLPLEKLLDGVRSFASVPGRLEKISGGGKTVFVDYAHTPDAMEKVLRTLKPLTSGKLWVVFGCGGDRDRGKRPQMAAVAERLADRVVVTDDNPRTEDSVRILEDIRAGFADKALPVFIADRASAIAHALRTAEPGDTVAVVGKGHEDYQIVGTVKHHFSDKEQVLQILG